MKKAHFIQQILLALSTNKVPFGLLIIALSCTPTIALANAGTPFLMTLMGQLIFGNALIGVVEGLLLAVFFRLSIAKSVVSLIVINYISAWTGVICIYGGLYCLESLFGSYETAIHLRNVIYLTLFFFSFCLTLLIETPLLIWEVRKTGLVRKSIIKASVCINMVTYSFLLVWYVNALSQPTYSPAFLAKYEKVQRAPVGN